MQISHDPGSHDSDPGPQEKSMKKSCVSFETECINKEYPEYFTQVVHKGMDTEYSHSVVYNIHTNQGSQCSSVPTYTLVVHNVALY